MYIHIYFITSTLIKYTSTCRKSNDIVVQKYATLPRFRGEQSDVSEICDNSWTPQKPLLERTSTATQNYRGPDWSYNNLEIWELIESEPPVRNVQMLCCTGIRDPLALRPHSICRSHRSRGGFWKSPKLSLGTLELNPKQLFKKILFRQETPKKYVVRMLKGKVERT